MHSCTAKPPWRPCTYDPACRTPILAPVLAERAPQLLCRPCSVPLADLAACLPAQHSLLLMPGCEQQPVIMAEGQEHDLLIVL
jgi:hypothetical protein